MAEGRVESGSDENQINSQNQACLELRKYLILTTKGSFKWKGCFETLKQFLDSILKVQTKWSTPGSGCKF